jgi:hypothetical protein
VTRRSAGCRSSPTPSRAHGCSAKPERRRAQNADPNARAHFLSPIKVVGKHAKLKVRYRCASGEALWVSAKQAKSRKKTAKLTIHKVEPGSKGKLKKGRAWVQFCVTQGEETLILSKSGWVKVKRGAPQPY